MQITILKPKEMAKELGISNRSLTMSINEDPDFPMIKIGVTRRFVKEKVVEYIDLKKKLDCVPNQEVFSLILL